MSPELRAPLDQGSELRDLSHVGDKSIAYGLPLPSEVVQYLDHVLPHSP